MTEGSAVQTPLSTDAALARLSEESRVTVAELTIVQQDDGYVVGNPDAGVFVKLPEIGVTAIDHLRNGEPIGQVARAISGDQPDERDVDVLEFAQTLIELGFVTGIDGVDVGAAERDAAEQRRWISGPGPERVRWLFGRTAWTIYAAMFAFCLIAEVAEPAYRPRSGNFFFLSDPLLSIAILTPVSFVLTGIHECFHWLAASAQGISARFSISRRLYFLVFETDLTQLWSLPRRRRYGSLLAGMGFDATLLAMTIALRMLLDGGVIAAPPVVYRLLAAVGVLLTMSLSWQFCIFLRNDLYLVTSLALGCVNLWRISMLELKNRLWRLSDDERSELTSADERDRAHARWFSWLCVIGVGGALWFAQAVVLPALWHTLWSIYNHLATSSAATPRFWGGIAFGVLALLPNGLTIYVFARDLTRRRRLS